MITSASPHRIACVAQMQRLEARAANLVQRHGRHCERQARLDRSLTCRILPGTRRQHLAHDHLIHLRTVQTGLRQQLADDGGAEIHRRNIRQRTLETAHRGAGSGNDYDVLHGANPQWCATRRRPGLDKVNKTARAAGSRESMVA